MNLDKIRTMVGFAIKSGNIIMGCDNIEQSKKPIHLIIADKSISDRTLTTLQRIANSKKSKLLILDSSLEDIVLKTNCKVVAILDRNMSKNIIINADNTAEEI